MVSVAIVGAKRMQTLNKIYRGKEYVANVLSFEGEGKELGEVILCLERIRKDAKEYDITLREAFCRMFVHGLLHLLGHSHETAESALRMERMEKKYRAAVSQFS